MKGGQGISQGISGGQNVEGGLNREDRAGGEAGEFRPGEQRGVAKGRGKG